MKTAVYILFFLIFSVAVKAQPYGNEWVDYSQKYFKIKVPENGIYRIDYLTLKGALASLGDDLDNMHPKRFQVFGRGEESYIYVEGENDGSFDASDYIEFYAQKNDGWLDSLIYKDPQYQSNPHLSLFNDTAVYFLTWTNPGDTNNLRMGLKTNTNFTGLTPAAFFYKEGISIASQEYLQGELNADGKSDPEYMEGEGWFRRIGYPSAASSTTLQVNTQNAYSGAGNAIVNAVIAGASNDQSINPDHHILIKHGSSSPSTTILDDYFDGYSLQKYTMNIPAADLQSTTTYFKFESGSLSPSPPSSYTGVSHVYIKYPHTFDLESKPSFEMSIPTGNDYLEMTNLNATTAWLYDLSNHNKITVVNSSGTFKARLDYFPSERKCFIVSEGEINQVTTLQKVTSTALFTDYTNLEKDSAFVMITHSSLWTEAGNYKSYRDNLQSVLVNIDELYDQFAYGVEKHPLSIRHLSHYILDTWSTPPQSLFLIGKSIISYKTRFDPVNFKKNLIPAFGFPASDNLFTAFMNGTMFEPAIPTGRLSAKSNAEVANYLRKVGEYEGLRTAANHTLAGKEWMKNILHFGGGSSEGEQNVFKSFLKIYEDSIEGPYYGGNVFSFYKTTTDPIQTNIADTVTDLINNGVSIITFFGHAAGSSFDISIGVPGDYSNSNGKYPFMIANSCNAGDIHQPVTVNSMSTSEDFVLADRGGIAFLSSVSLGYAVRLHQYTQHFYTNIGKTNFNKSIGSSIKNVITAIQGNGQNFITKSTCLEMTLHGDPALVIHPQEKPDYAIESSSIYFTPGIVTTDVDSFDIHVIVNNLGKAIKTSLGIIVKREFPSGTDTIYSITMPPVYFKDTLTLRLPVDEEKGIGINNFSISLDPNSLIDELSEGNNDLLNHPLIITSNELIPVYPYNYAIVPDNEITLKASTADPFAPQRNYIIQIDTIDSYNSSMFREKSFTTSGGVVEWQIGASYFSYSGIESPVYYWRCSPDSTSPDKGHRWKESSFQIIDDKNGWGQSHRRQFKKDAFFALELNNTSPWFQFTPVNKELRCNVLGNPVNQAEMSKTEYRLNGALGDFGICWGAPAIYIAVIDSLTLEPWESYHSTANPDPNDDYGNENGIISDCRPSRADKFFIFKTSDPAQMNAMASMLNIIPNGHYILAYTAIRGSFQDTTKWDTNHFQAFEDLGADSIRTVGDSIPYIFFVKKGYPATAQEAIGTKPDDNISLTALLTSNLPYGTVESPLIGPAKSWKSFHWDQFALENPTDDSVRVKIYGVDIDGNSELKANLTPATPDLYTLSDSVNSSAYPFLKLEAFIQDDSLLTSAQLNHWRIMYDLAPEAAVNAADHYFFHKDTLQQGEELKFSMAIQNISNVDMDSLRVEYWIEDRTRNALPLDYPLQAPLKAGEKLVDEVSYSTSKLSGFNSFWMEVNPKDSLWQVEQHHFNNIARVGFFVNKDKTNPLLDVTFDGIHILDGDIVSPKPHILIQLKDENQFMALDDTADFSVYLTDPDGAQQRIYFINSKGEEILSFTKAQLPANSAKIEYKPYLKKDGEYELLVRAQDASNNKAGKMDYTISFEVINKSTITNILNYPNPFSTSTRFVFTLTGEYVPDYFRIQILTITGKVVREITQAEIGPINIGRNVSDYAWNGTDEFGDRLANGIYLYRVITKINGEGIEHRSTESDRFFHKGFGKMYLLR